MKEELRDFYIKKGQTMTREEMMTYVFGNSIVDKLNNREKELMSKDEQKIFNTAYEEGWDDGYSDGHDDGHTDGCINGYNEGTKHLISATEKAYKNGVIKAMSWFENALIKDFHFDSGFVRQIVMKWAEADLLIER